MSKNTVIEILTASLHVTRPWERKAIAWGVLAVGLATVLVSHYVAACGAFPPNPFDGALFLLQSIYASRGLTPYLDYGFVYPPGVALLFGKLFGLPDSSSVMKAVWASSLLLVGTNMFFAFRLAQGPSRIFGVGLYLILGGIATLLWAHIGTEPFTHSLLLLILLLTLHGLRSGISPSRITLVGLAAFAITLVRWDRALVFTAVEIALAGVAWGGVWLCRMVQQDVSEVREQALRLVAAVAATLTGVGVALALIAGIAIGSHAWVQTRTFIFDVPLSILPFRTLPVPKIESLLASQTQWLTSLLALGLLILAGALASWRNRRKVGKGLTRLIELGVLCAGPISILPYAFGRADSSHFLPLTLITGAAMIVAILLWNGRENRVACLLGLLILALPLTGPLVETIRSLGIPICGQFQRVLEGTTADCTRLIPPGTRSLFVGQVSYQRFIVNWPILYLARADLPPATPFISDEPGVQNTCAYGAQIAANLAKAPRPTVAFLDTEPMDPEPNLTRTMQNCGRIEDALRSFPARELGLCRFRGRPIRAVLYTE